MESSSVAAATVCTLAEVCWAADETVTDCWVVWPATAVMVCAVASISVAAEDRPWVSADTLLSKRRVI